MKSQSCWLHIGMHKTGTSSIQKTLAVVPPTNEWAYLTLGRYQNLGIPLHAMFESPPYRYHWFKKKGLSDERVAKMGQKWRIETDQFLKCHNSQNVLISAEGATLLKENELIKLRDFLLARFKQVRVIASVRSPAAYVSSMFQQSLKFGVVPFTKIVNRSLPNYRDRFEKFDRVFGNDSVELWRFSPEKLHDNCLIADFCHRIGMPAPSPERIVRANESMSLPAAGLLYSYLKHSQGYGSGPGVIAQNRALHRALFKLPGDKFKLAQQPVLEVLKSQEDQIAWMSKRLGEDIDDRHNASVFGSVSDGKSLLLAANGNLVDFVSVFVSTTNIDASAISLPEVETPESVAAVMQQCRDAYVASKLKI